MTDQCCVCREDCLAVSRVDHCDSCGHPLCDKDECRTHFYGKGPNVGCCLGCWEKICDKCGGKCFGDVRQCQETSRCPQRHLEYCSTCLDEEGKCRDCRFKLCGSCGFTEAAMQLLTPRERINLQTCGIEAYCTNLACDNDICSECVQRAWLTYNWQMDQGSDSDGDYSMCEEDLETEAMCEFEAKILRCKECTPRQPVFLVPELEVKKWPHVVYGGVAEISGFKPKDKFVSKVDPTMTCEILRFNVRSQQPISCGSGSLSVEFEVSFYMNGVKQFWKAPVKKWKEEELSAVFFESWKKVE